MSKNWAAVWREPLVHFIILGAIVFGLHTWFVRAQADAERTISISAPQIQRLSAVWEAETGREPTAQDIEGMLADYVREEVLYREALKLGLDRDDTIIRRRLAQKLGFLIEREDDLEPLTEVELREAFAKNPSVYARPDLISFAQVPYNFARDGSDRTGEIAGDLSSLKTDSALDSQNLGDPFLLARAYKEISEADLARLFGQDFAKVLFAQDDGVWIGPIRSRLADHLVRIDVRVEGGVPAFEDIVAEVRARESDIRTRKANEEAWLELRERYVIKITDGT